MSTVKATGSVRVDLLGGTLDLNPINLIIPDVVTLNLATSLKAQVEIEKTSDSSVVIESIDYKKNYSFQSHEITKENLNSDYFKEMTFIMLILNFFKINKGVLIRLQSGSPAGAGLGGSSAMGVTLYKGLCDFCSCDFNHYEAFKVVNNIEAKILNAGPAGYQDYQPALHGGVLAIRPGDHSLDIEQLFSKELKAYLEDHLTLVYSGQSRDSGINNWEVYKSFFDKDDVVVKGLNEIARLSNEAYESIKSSNYANLVQLIAKEGDVRANLFPSILTNEMKALFKEVTAKYPDSGIKACGAGGGGCFLLTHKPSEKEIVKSLVEKAGMSKLKFNIEEPLS